MFLHVFLLMEAQLEKFAGFCLGVFIISSDQSLHFLLVEDVLGKPLETIKVVLIKDGTELCTVGFLGREFAAFPSQWSKYIDKFAQVLELYDDNENSMMRKKSKRNAGMASFRLMEDIQGQE